MSGESNGHARRAAGGQCRSMTDAAAPLLRDPDFRRLWAVGLITYLVRWLEVLVVGVFTYERTGSAFAVASMLMVGAVSVIFVLLNRRFIGGQK